MAKKKRKANATYDLLPCTLDNSTKRILSLDPGSKNTGIAIVAINKNKTQVVANSILTNPLYDLTKFLQQREIFREEIDNWIQTYKPNGIIIERFQARGLLGSLGELVSIMIGIISERYSLPIKLVTASTWKNQWNRKFLDYPLDDLYKKCKITPHQLDAILIGRFGLELGLKIELKDVIIEIIKQSEQTSLIPLIKRKQ
jgi:hypothetical protein